MTLETLKKEIALNGGATLTHKGDMIALDTGFMVSLADCETITTLDAFDEKTFKRYLKLARKKKAYFGAWNDNGQLYIDISIRVADKATARRIGKKNNQLAIFDLSKCESIYLK